FQMSVSSGSSLCGDDDHDLLGNDEEDLDFYAILNVPTDATHDEITKAYRKRCLIFHPDRHTDDNDKRAAEKIFVQLKRAHETLMDPKQRAIYDALGVQGLDQHGWQLVSRSENPDNIRREYEFLQRLKERELMLQRTHPTSGFHVKTSLAGLFAKNPDYRYGPQFISIGISQGVDCPLTQSDRVGLVGRVRAGNGRGDGSVSAVWKRSTANWHLENTVTVSADTLHWTGRAGRNLSPRSTIILQPSLQWYPLQQMCNPAVALIFSHQLRRNWQGSIILSASPTNSALTTNILHTENNQPKALCNIALSPSNPHLRLVYFTRQPTSDSVTEMAVTISPFGIAPSIQAERRLSRFTRVGVSLAFAFPSCTLTAKFKARAGGASYEWSIVLCDDKDELSRSALYGVALPYCVFQIGRVVFRPWIEKLTTLFDDPMAEGQVDAAKAEESERIISLMRPTAERIAREEEEKKGIVIVEAKYGQTDPLGSRSYPVMGDRSIDVTVPLQSMVHDSQLRVFSVKSQLPGFHDPAPGFPKVLMVKYRFRDEPHAVCIPDDMPLTIPLRSHRLTMDNGR
ncbi:hypothetical protein PENTCL1PPCAC_8088, partial [Pristionchus entomophagus]